MDEVMTAREAAEMIGVSYQRVRQMLVDGTLEGVKRAKVWLIPRENVEALAAKRERGALTVPDGHVAASEMARRLDVSRERVRQILDEGRIPNRVLGTGMRVVKEEDLEAYIRQIAAHPPTGGRGHTWDDPQGDRLREPPPEGLLSYEQVAERLAVSVSKVQELVREGELPVVELENPVRRVVREEDLEDFITSHEIARNA